MQKDKKKSPAEINGRLAKALSQALLALELEKLENERLRTSLKLAEELIFSGEKEKAPEPTPGSGEGWTQESTVPSGEKARRYDAKKAVRELGEAGSPAMVQMASEWQKIVSLAEIGASLPGDPADSPLIKQARILGRDAFPWQLPVPDHYLDRWTNSAWEAAALMASVASMIPGIGRLKPVSPKEDPGMCVKRMAGAYGMACAFWGFEVEKDFSAFAALIVAAAKKAGSPKDFGRAVEAVAKAFCDPNSGVKIYNTDPLARGYQGSARRTKANNYRFAYGIRHDEPPEPIKLGWRNGNFYENGR